MLKFKRKFRRQRINIILPSKSGSSKLSLPSVLLSKTLCSPFLPTVRTTCPANLLFFITRTILGEENRSLSSSLCSLLQYFVYSSLLGPDILFSTLLSHTLSLCSFLKITDHVLHPYKKQANLQRYVHFVDSKLEDKEIMHQKRATSLEHGGRNGEKWFISSAPRHEF